MTVREIIRRNPASLGLLVWMAVMPLLFSTFSGYQGWQYAGWLNGLTFAGWTWFYLLSIFTMALAFTPTTFVATLSGAFLGFQSLWYLVPSYLMASLLGYLLARKMGAGALRLITHTYPRSEVLLHNLRSNELLLVILCRISPILPFAIMNVVLSYAGIRLLPFLAGGLIGMLPRTVLAVMLGMQLDAVLRGELTALLWIGLLAVSIAGLGWLFKRAIPRE